MAGRNEVAAVLRFVLAIFAAGLVASQTFAKVPPPAAPPTTKAASTDTLTWDDLASDEPFDHGVRMADTPEATGASPRLLARRGRDIPLREVQFDAGLGSAPLKMPVPPPETPRGGRRPPEAEPSGNELLADSLGDAAADNGEASDHESLEPAPMEDWDMAGEADERWPIGAPADSSGTWFHRGKWYGAVEATFLSRTLPNVRIRSSLIAVDTAANFRPSILLLSRGLGFAPGGRTTIGRYLGRDEKNRDHQFEFTFAGLNDWSETRGLTSVLGTDTLDSVLGNVADSSSLILPGFVGTERQQYTYNSSYNSFEFDWRVTRRMSRDRMVLTRDGNWVRTAVPAPLPSLFGGLRIVSLEEDLEYLSLSTDPAQRRGRYHVDTNNLLVGLQVGSDYFYQHTNWTVGIRGKAGPYINWDEQKSQVLQVDTTLAQPVNFTRDERDSNRGLAFVGEINLIGAIQLRPNLSLRGSYDFMWMNQLALAPNQVTFVVPNPPRVNDGGSLFFQGASVGLEFSW